MVVVVMAAGSKILLREASRDGLTVLLVDGVLDSTTYLPLRDGIIKAALDEPPAVVVNISALRVPAPSAYAVFTSARWQVSRWPDVPVLLVCGHATGRAALRRQGVTRWVPVHDSLDSAVGAVDEVWRHVRLRRRAELPSGPECAKYARNLVTEWLWDWGHGDKIGTAKIIASELVANVYRHTDSAPVLRVETEGAEVTVAVSDRSTSPASRIESKDGSFRLSGLHLVAALADAWGSAPTPNGKTVWATIR